MDKLQKYSDGTLYVPVEETLQGNAPDGIDQDPLWVSEDTVDKAVKDKTYYESYGNSVATLIKNIQTLRKFVEVEGALDDVYDEGDTLGKYFDWAESQLTSAI